MQLELIWATARYEMITLLRGWFFRIFAGACVVLFITIDVIFFSTAVDVPRFFNGMSCSAPYANMMMLNLAQVVVFIMLATDFFKRDKKMNTTEVFYIRSMTNFTYLSGKLLGIFLIFAGLDILLLMAAAIIQVVFSDITFNWFTYVIYPLVMVFPVFVFIAGLAFVLMNLIKNQAIVVLILLGYCAAEMFYLRDKLFFVFDFLAMNLPLAYSDFVGFSNGVVIFWQRSIYVCAGLALLLIAGLIFVRLPQSVPVRRIAAVLSVLFVVLASVFAYTYINFHQNLLDRRAEMRRLDREYLDQISVEPVHYDIELQHLGSRINANTRIIFKNSSSQNIRDVFFSINPKLSVSRIEYGNQQPDFEQSGHILKIHLPQALIPSETDSIHIFYSGTIDPSVSYPDIRDDQFSGRFSFWLYQVQKAYVFLTPRYVLLSPETLWYPRPGLPRGSIALQKDQKYFCTYSLSISTAEDLTAVSQGELIKAVGGLFVFRSDKPLPDLSITIGDYLRESVTSDSVEYCLYRHPAHDYYREYFAQIPDTLKQLIQEVQQEYSVRLNLDYPYNRLVLIEVPIQFYAHPRIFTIARETIQPEQVWFTENAAYVNTADFNRLKESMDRRLDRSNQTMTESELQATMFKNFIRYTFLGQTIRFMRGVPTMTYDPDFNLFPNYYTFVNYFSTNGQPILNAAVESYLYNKVKQKQDGFTFVRTEGLTADEKVSRLLTEKSLSELINAPEKDALLSDVIKIKGAYLLKTIQSDVGADRLDQLITERIQKYRFAAPGFTEIIDDLYADRNFNLPSFLDNWMNTTQLPGFITSGIQMFKILDQDRLRYQVLFQIQNTESVNGVVEVTFEYGGRGRRMMTDAPEEVDPGRVFRIDPGQSSEIGIVLDSEPRSVNIDYIIGKNIPLVYSEQFDKADLNERFLPFEGQRDATDLARLISDNEIIVDNADSTFMVVNPPYQSLIKRWILTEEKEVEFDRYRWWSAPQRWRLLKNTTFFGRYIHSAYYTRSGDGDRPAVWKTVLPVDGLYDVYTYMFRKDDLWRGRRDNQISYGDYHYIVDHSGGSDEVTIDADQASPGWNYIGTYFFERDSARVLLTNKSNGRVIIADAVKWVKN